MYKQYIYVSFFYYTKINNVSINQIVLKIKSFMEYYICNISREIKFFFINIGINVLISKIMTHNISVVNFIILKVLLIF